MFARKSILLAITALFVASLACSTSSGAAPETQTPAPAQKVETRQWGASATASSQYGDNDWAAGQATGAPNTQKCGDFTTAWASSSPNGVDWLEVSYDTPVTPTQINIHETYDPGSIIKVEVRDTNGKYHVVFTGSPSVVSDCPRVLTLDVKDVSLPVNAVRISLDQTKSTSWNEIDAVELVGLK